MRPLLLALCASAVLVSGCGGAGSLVGFSIFEGDWVGTWDGAVDSGPASLSIDASGAVTGTMHADIGNEDGTVTGVVENDGSVALTVDFPSEGEVNGSGNWVLTNGGNSISGIVNFGGDPISFDLDFDTP